MLRLVTSCVALSLAALSHAGPPLIIEDPRTPGKGNWETNISYQLERNTDEWEHQVPEFDINFGLFENDEWNVVFPLVAFDKNNKPPILNSGDMFVGWKYRFLDEEDFSPGVASLVKVTIPTGQGNNALEDAGSGLIPEVNGGQWKIEMTAVFAKTLGCDDQYYCYAEVTYIFGLEESQTDNFEAGFACEWSVNGDLVLVGSIISSVYEDPEEADFIGFEAGLIYQLNDDFALMGSMGRSFRENSSGAPMWLTFVGFQYVWESHFLPFARLGGEG